MTLATEKPTKIFQYWDKPKPPGDVARMMRSWKNHGIYRRFLFTYAKAKTFIKNHFDKRTLDAFKQCRLPAMQADFFRYCALYVHGGIYIDADIKLAEGKFDKFHKLIASCNHGLVMPRRRAIANDFIFIRNPGNLLIKKVLEQAIINIEQRQSNNVWKVTGPGIMTELYREKEQNEELFKDLNIVEYDITREFLEFKWNLRYKKGDGHWTNAQQEHSIYQFVKRKPEEKIFCVGFNKTGTSSLHAYFKYHGMKSLHNLIWQEATHYLGPKRLETFLQQYDAYSDGEMANIERVYELYPDAYYILNVRELDAWIKSRIKWIHRDYPKQVTGPMAQDYRNLQDKAVATWIKRRNSYHQYIIDFFQKHSGNLLVVNVCTDQEWVTKCDEFTGLQTSHDVEFHSNKQVLTEMTSEKKVYLNNLFQSSLESAKNICATSSYPTEEVVTPHVEKDSNPYALRVNLKHLVRTRFNRS